MTRDARRQSYFEELAAAVNAGAAAHVLYEPPSMPYTD
jgi:hypothetical protein